MAKKRVNFLNNGLESQRTLISSCNSRIDGLNVTTSKIVNEDLADIGSGATIVGHARLAEEAVATYNGKGSPICVTLNTSNQIQFRWSNNQIEVFVDKTRIGYMTTH